MRWTARPSSRGASPGFTIIELLIVMTVIVILASMGMTQYRSSVTRAEEAVLKENLFRMRDAMDQFYADKNKWPSDLSELVSEGYIREIPEDPMTKSKDTWVTKPAEPDASNPSSAGGIEDVHSGSDRVALDGSRYADWN
ncbi:MAG TPA: type II secretion system protein [Vicinamibacterales bacterium]|nr:type II secretion system protein [Vicinamibacterales bacterium]